MTDSPQYPQNPADSEGPAAEGNQPPVGGPSGPADPGGPQYPQYPGYPGYPGGAAEPGGQNPQDPSAGGPGGQYPQNPQYPGYPGGAGGPGGEPPQGPGQYGQYPAGQQYGQAWQPGVAPPPKSIMNAVYLMYVGAGISLIGAIFALFSRAALRSAILQATTTPLTPSQLNTAVNFGYYSLVAGGFLGVALWLWMAQSNKKGKSWARIVATVFFGISTLGLFLTLARARAAGTGVVEVLTWLIGLGAIIFMYQRASSEYYSAVTGQRGYR